MRICDRCGTNLRSSYGVTYRVQRFEAGERESIHDTQLDFCAGCDPDIGSAKQAELANATVAKGQVLDGLPDSPYLEGLEKALDAMGAGDAKEEPESWVAGDDKIKAFLERYAELAQADEGLTAQNLAALWEAHGAKHWLVETIQQKQGLLSLHRAHLGHTDLAGNMLTLASMYGLMPADPHLL
jgi:hypothetical protein